MPINVEEFLATCQNVEKVRKTIFDKGAYNVRLDESLVGEALRGRLIEISQVYDNVARMAAHYSLLVELSEAKKKYVKSLVYVSIKDTDGYKKANAEDKKVLFETCEVKVDGETTCIIEEDKKIAILNYMATRGKNKEKEISSILDLGRTLLSWDKGAIGKVV